MSHRCAFGCDQGSFVRLCAMRMLRGMERPPVTLTHAEVIAALDAMEKPPSSPSIALARPVKALSHAPAHEATTEAERVLSAAGWTRSERKGYWRDPASEDDYPEWRAVQVARRDASIDERGAA